MWRCYSFPPQQSEGLVYKFLYEFRVHSNFVQKPLLTLLNRFGWNRHTIFNNFVLSQKIYGSHGINKIQDFRGRSALVYESRSKLLSNVHPLSFYTAQLRPPPGGFRTLREQSWRMPQYSILMLIIGQMRVGFAHWGWGFCTIKTRN